MGKQDTEENQQSQENYQPSGYTASPLLQGSKNKKFRETGWRWVMLILACFLLFGSYYCYDNPQALNSSIKRKYNIGGSSYGLLYTVYSLPNIVLPLFGGIFIDRIGVRPAIILFSLFLVAGQIIFAFSAIETKGIFWMALVGRVVFGLGGESLGVGQSTIVARWFKGKELATSLGLAISISRLASVVNDNIEPIFGYDGDKQKIFWGLILGAVFCVMSTVIGFLLNCMDRYADKRDHSQGQLAVSDEDKFSFSDLKKLSCLYYLVITNCLLTYLCVFPFLSVATSYFEVRFAVSEKHAGNVVSTTYLISGLLTPFLGFLVDKIGKRPLLILVSDVALICSHLYLLLSPDCTGVGGLALLGVSFSLYASVIWPSIAFIVQPKILGTAYGLATAVQNGGLALGPFVVGVLIDAQKIKVGDKKVQTSLGYQDVSYMMLGVAGVSLLVGVFIWIQDCRTGNVLSNRDQKKTLSNMLASPSPEEREQILEDSNIEDNIKAYLTSPRSKNSLRRSFYGGAAK